VSEGNFPCGHTRNDDNIVMHVRLGRSDVAQCRTCKNTRRAKSAHSEESKEKQRRKYREKKLVPDIPDQKLGSWVERGLCVGADPELFYPSKDEGAPTGPRDMADRQRHQAALNICARCPVQSDCLTWALTTKEMYGVWGCTTPRQRVKMLGLPRLPC
jgi:WhiB family redox-sensing transcriptional regulator